MEKVSKSQVFAIILILSGVILLLKTPIQNALIKYVISKNQLETLTTEIIQENASIAGEFDFDQTVNVDWDQVVAGYQSRDNLPVIGGLAIPSLSLRLPLMKGLANENLIAGVGTMIPEQQMGKGNYALVGHNMGRTGVLFSDIQYIELGTTIYLTDLENIYVYEVTGLEMLSPTRVEVLNEVPGKNVLTLITCSNDLQSRWICRGELSETIPYEEASEEIIEALKI